MDKIIRQLDELASKKEITEAQSRNAVQPLFQLYTEMDNKEKIAEYLMKFRSVACLLFFEKLISMNKELSEIKSLHKAIRETDTYKGNINHVSTYRAFGILAVIIKYKHEYAQEAISITLSDIKTSETVVKHFKKHVIDYCGLDAVQKLMEQDWENPAARNRLNDLLQQAVSNNSTTIVHAPTTVKLPDSEPQAVVSCVEELKPLEVAIKKLIDMAEAPLGTVDSLKKQLSERDERISTLKAQIASHDVHVSELEEQLQEREERINSLTEQLKTSMQMDTISQNQELATLKKELAKALSLEYGDYLSDKDKSCNPTTFEGFVGSLKNIFKTLQRYGIIIDEEGIK